MPPRLQWALFFLMVILLGGYFIYAGGDGPCGHPGDILRNPNCHHSTATRGGG